MRAGGETETVNVLLHHVFRFLDPFGNFHFLFASQKRHLTHLFEIHPDRVIQNVQLRLRFFFLLLVDVFFNFFMPVDVGCFDNIDLHFAKPR